MIVVLGWMEDQRCSLVLCCLSRKLYTVPNDFKVTEADGCPEVRRRSGTTFKSVFRRGLCAFGLSTLTLADRVQGEQKCPIHYGCVLQSLMRQGTIIRKINEKSGEQVLPKGPLNLLLTATRYTGG